MNQIKATLSKEQLDFITFMHKGTILRPDLKERLNECENKIYNPAISKPNSTKQHSPKKMIEFLSLFSRDDRFKWFTHRWDLSVEFRIEELKVQLTANKHVLSQMAYGTGETINLRTYNQVWNFINFDNSRYPWKNNQHENIRYGWHSILEQSLKNPTTPVEYIKLENGHLFKDYIRMFKSTIEFRTDLEEKDRFSELIWNTLRTNLPKDFNLIFKPQFDKIGYDLNIYCDVTAILDALVLICNWIVKHKTNSTQISIDLTANKNSYELIILHHNSYFINKSKLINPSGDFAALRNRLFSVCDFKMEGDYKHDGVKSGSLTIYALDNTTHIIENTISPCHVITSDTTLGGIKYTFTIYK